MINLALSREKFAFFGPFHVGSICRTIDGSLNLKPYLTIFCNVIEPHDENAVGLVETY